MGSTWQWLRDGLQAALLGLSPRRQGRGRWAGLVADEAQKEKREREGSWAAAQAK